MYSTDPTVVSSGAAGAILAMMAGLWLFIMIVAVFMIVMMWKVFVKAGKPGWAAIIPIYNVIVLLEIVEKPVWWIFLMLIPFVNVVVEIIVMLELAKKFGKSAAFAVFGLILFPIVGWPMLAFGKATYQGAAPIAPVEAPTAE